MARGFESKFVEEQQSQAAQSSNNRNRKPPLTPEQISQSRIRQGLLLQRTHLIHRLEAAKNPKHRSMLETALADMNARLAQLG